MKRFPNAPGFASHLQIGPSVLHGILIAAGAFDEDSAITLPAIMDELLPGNVNRTAANRNLNACLKTLMNCGHAGTTQKKYGGLHGAYVVPRGIAFRACEYVEPSLQRGHALRVEMIEQGMRACGVSENAISMLGHEAVEGE